MESELKEIIKDAAGRLSGFKRREYQSEITLNYFGGSARKAGREMGWGRECVKKALKERESGIRCADNYQGRGEKRTEDKIPGLKEDMIFLAERETPADPAMKSSLIYARITGKAMREALIREKVCSDEDLPAAKAVGNILNRLGYNLKRVLKSKPLKKNKGG